jgi:hypothetical protein
VFVSARDNPQTYPIKAIAIENDLNKKYGLKMKRKGKDEVQVKSYLRMHN